MLDAPTGLRVNNAATKGNVLLGNGPNFVSSALALSKLPAGSVTSKGRLIGVGAAGGTLSELSLSRPGLRSTAGTLVSSNLFAYKASSESVTSSTGLQNDNELSVTLSASTAYFVDLFIPVSQAGTSAGFKLAFGGTATVSSFNLQVLAVDPAALF